MRHSLSLGAARAAAVLSLGALLSSCGSDDPVAPVTKDPSATVSAILAQVDNSLSQANSSAGTSGAQTPSTSSATDDPNKCVFDAATKFWVCPEHAQPNGLKVVRKFQFLNANNVVQDHFDTLTTTQLRNVLDITGTSPTQIVQQNGNVVPATQTVNNHSDITVSGIRTTTRLHNGTGTMAVVLNSNGVLPTANITVTQTFANMQYPTNPAPGTAMYPLGGTITADVTSQTGTHPTTTTHQVTTYDGTAIMKIVITLPGGTTRTCTINMAVTNSTPSCTP